MVPDFIGGKKKEARDVVVRLLCKKYSTLEGVLKKFIVFFLLMII